MELTINIPTKAKKIILGVSGGRDSMALCYALKNQIPNLQIITAHVDHGFREDSFKDAEFVKKTMSEWGLKCEVLKLKKIPKGNLEAWGREKRYDFFEKLRIKHKADFILTAHHKDDDIETILMNILRGSKVKGLSGMPLLREKLLRPLLFTSRKEINSYIKFHKINFVEDPSNADNVFKRNALRNQLIPKLEKLNPDFGTRIQEQKEYWLSLQEMLEKDAKKFLGAKTKKINKKAYSALPLPLRFTVLEILYFKNTGLKIQSSSMLKRWDTAILTWQTGKKTEWHKNKFLFIKKEYAEIK